MRLLIPAVLILAGCGSVGDPLPPSLKIPNPAPELRAREIGDRIVVEFTTTAESTDGVVLEQLSGVELRVGPTRGADFEPAAWEQQSKAFEIAHTTPGPVKFEVPAREWVGQEVAVAARVRGPNGRASAWSPYAVLTVVEPLAKPAGVRATAIAEGVRVEWSGAPGGYRVFRSTGDAEPQEVGEAQGTGFVDATAVYEVEYRYTVQAFRGQAVSEWSDPATVKAVDVFAPAAPIGLAVVVSPVSIELTWEPVAARDLRGYRVYRAVGDGEFARVSELVTTPAFSDRGVQAGTRYRYAVTSVDQAGNESARSQAAAASAP